MVGSTRNRGCAGVRRWTFLGQRSPRRHHFDIQSSRFAANYLFIKFRAIPISRQELEPNHGPKVPYYSLTLL